VSCNPYILTVFNIQPSEVRKVVALSIPPTDRTIDALVSRTRDVDNAVRRVIYHHCLPQIPLPRYFSIAQREQILRNGLGDRDETVKASTAKLIGQWVDLFGGNLLEYLDTFELVSGTEVAEDALKALFKHRPDVLDSIKFEGAYALVGLVRFLTSRLDSYWTDLLTPEKAFLARVFADHCVATKDEARMEATLPVVTALAFRIQLAYNHLIECHQHDDETNPFEAIEERRKAEDEILDYEFVVGELFKLALNMDYADEIGRRKMFALVGEMVRQEALPESLIPGCLDILAKLSPSERDFIRMMVENIQSMRDAGVNVDEEVVRPT
jgi:condensin complex subunit 3